MEEERYIAQRSSFLKRSAGLRKDVAEAVAYRELGYSNSGISNKTGTNQGTIGSWMDRVAAEFGFEAHQVDGEEGNNELERVEFEKMAELPEETRDDWATVAARNRSHVPESFKLESFVQYHTTHDKDELLD